MEIRGKVLKFEKRKTEADKYAKVALILGILNLIFILALASKGVK